MRRILIKPHPTSAYQAYPTICTCIIILSSLFQPLHICHIFIKPLQPLHVYLFLSRLFGSVQVQCIPNLCGCAIFLIKPFSVHSLPIKPLSSSAGAPNCHQASSRIGKDWYSSLFSSLCRCTIFKWSLFQPVHCIPTKPFPDSAVHNIPTKPYPNSVFWSSIFQPLH